MVDNLTKLTIAFFALLTLAIPGFAGQLDDYYLDGFAEQPVATALQKAILLQAGDMVEVPHCGTPLKHGLQRDWNKLEPSTQKLLAKQVAAPVLSGAELTLLSPSGRFAIHYTTSGVDAVPSLAWVQTVAQTFDDVATSYSSRGWRMAPTVAGAPYDVYLLNLAPQRIYGQTTSGQIIPSAGFPNAFSSFLEIDNDFAEVVYTGATGGPYSPTQSLQITAAHEYQHAIQYGYNFFFDIWFAEATSTWHEDELYDGVNQLYNYIPAWFNNSTLPLDTAVSTTTGGGYGRWIFNRFLSEQHGAAVVRSAWEKLATFDSPGGNADIPMVPVLENLLLTSPLNSNLTAEFFAFAKRVYDRNWAGRPDPADVSRIHAATPVASFASYPVNATRFPGSTSVTLPHYSFVYYKFTPAGAAGDLTIAISRTSGIRTAVFKKTAGTISEILASPSGSYTVAGFGALNAATDEVVLLVANATNINNHTAAFSTDGSISSLVEPSNTPASSLSPTAGVVTSGGATSSGGGSGCFIATAAYGSYLHPQVRVLRDFRDRYLLTNLPGRAFVALYYRLSPPLADFIAGHELLRGITRVALTPIIIAVAHPVMAGCTLLLVGGLLLHRPLRRRLKACEANC